MEGVQDSDVVRCDVAQMGNKFMAFFRNVHKHLHNFSSQNTVILGHVTVHTSKLARRMCLDRVAYTPVCARFQKPELAKRSLMKM